MSVKVLPQYILYSDSKQKAILHHWGEVQSLVFL